MEVEIVSPYGYCAGVVLAFKKTAQAKLDYPDRPIYLLGMLVHNEESVRLLAKEGFLLIDERKRDLKEALEELPEGSVVIFSAHGHPDIYEQIAKARGLIAIDSTCMFVNDNVESAKAELTKGNEVIYLGSKGHLETSGFLANVDGCGFFDVKSGKFEPNGIKGDSPIVFCQTTLSIAEIDSALDALQNLYPNLRKARLRCHATQQRQDRIGKLGAEVDTVIVLGSRSSNNSLKLAEIAKSRGKVTYLCLNLDEVRSLDLSKAKHIALASGASTSAETLQEVHRYLLSL